MSPLLRFAPVLALLLASPVTARTLYVSATAGDDLAAGDEANPFATLQRCIDEWNDVDQVTCLGAGVFHEELVIDAGGPSADERNQLLPWDTDADGDVFDETFVLDGEMTRNIGIDILNGTHNGEIGHLTVRNYIDDLGCGGDETMHHVQFLCWGGCNDWWIHDCAFEDLGPECGARGDYISIQPRGAVRLVVERCSFDRIGGFVMRYYAGDDMVFRDNEVNIVSTGVKLWDTQPSIDGYGLSGYLFEGNVFTCDGNGRNPNMEGDCYSQTAISFADDVSDTIVRDNVFIDCLVDIHFATDETFGAVPQSGFLIERNHSIKTSNICNPWSGSFVAINDCTGPSRNTGEQMTITDVTIRNNLIEHVDGGIRQNAISLRSGNPEPFVNDYVIEHNTFRGHHEGIRIDNCDLEYRLNGVTIRNNLFAGIQQRYYSIWSGDPPTDWISDGNVFEPGAIFNWIETLSLEDWRAQTGQDLLSTACVPTFADARGFALDPSDTCAVDAGLPGSGPVEDAHLELRPRGAAPDAGADELWPDYLLDLRVRKTDRAPVLSLAGPPADLPAVRFHRGQLTGLRGGYDHQSPFGAAPALPECRSDPGDTVTDEGSGDQSWYYLAQSVVGRRPGAFRPASDGGSRPDLGETGCP
ncbi:MAG: hypothetical protein AAF533_05000 [Acidobacteriota bacterium]